MVNYVERKMIQDSFPGILQKKKLERKLLKIDKKAFMLIQVYTNIISVLLLFFGEKFVTQVLYRKPPSGHVQPQPFIIKVLIFFFL